MYTLELVPKFKNKQIKLMNERSERTVEYTVQPGDSLVQIAVKFDTSVSWLKEINNLYSDFLFPGDKLIIEKRSHFNQNMIRAKAEFITADIAITGVLSLNDHQLEFLPSNHEEKYIIHINTVDYVECNLLPHPTATFVGPYFMETTDQSPFLLLVTCVDEKTNENNSYMFKGIKCELQEFEKKLVSLKPPTAKCFSVKSISMPDLSSIDNKKKPLLPIKIVGPNSTILTMNEIDKLRDDFPRRYRNFYWRNLYQMNIHGCSYHTFFDKTGKFEPVLLVIKTNKGDKIGAFASRGLKNSTKVYGTGESFVFTILPDGDVCFYHWSKKNDYFTTSSIDEIAIGGGGASAIWIGGDLDRAYSQPCETFDSPQLTKDQSFRIINLEAWTFVESSHQV